MLFGHVFNIFDILILCFSFYGNEISPFIGKKLIKCKKFIFVCAFPFRFHATSSYWQCLDSDTIGFIIFTSDIIRVFFFRSELTIFHCNVRNKQFLSFFWSSYLYFRNSKICPYFVKGRGCTCWKPYICRSLLMIVYPITKPVNSQVSFLLPVNAFQLYTTKLSIKYNISVRNIIRANRSMFGRLKYIHVFTTEISLKCKVRCKACNRNGLSKLNIDVFSFDNSKLILFRLQQK